MLMIVRRVVRQEDGAAGVSDNPNAGGFYKQRAVSGDPQ